MPETTPPRPGRISARDIDTLEVVLSVLLSIALAHAIGAQNVAWAAFSGYMVMRGYVMDSLLRGVLRIGGTILGAILALLVVPLVKTSAPLSGLAAALIAATTLYGALAGRRAYAWLFIGLTFEMILLDQREHPGHALRGFVETRILEVCAGTAACVAVSALSAITLRRRWPGARMPRPARLGWNPLAARHAAQAGAAVGLLPLIGGIMDIPELAQGAVSIMAAMLVPVTTLGASGLMPVTRRLLQRVAGCLAGGTLAFLALLAAHSGLLAVSGSAPILLAATLAGVALGRRIETSGHAAAYVGTQFVLAVLVTLVPDSYATAAIAPALDRLAGILVGTALLEPVLVAWHLLAPGAGTSSPPGGGPA